MTDHITISTDAGGFQAYVARPDRPTAPVVVVLHEVFAVNADMRQTCGELAGLGFIAICPDLFWRIEPGLDLSVTSDADWKKALDLYAALDRDAAISDIAAAVRAARDLDGASGKVGLTGFCLGALLAFIEAAREPIDAVVAYHGAETEKYLGEASGITAPLLMHLAEEDEFISKEAQVQIKAALAGKPHVEVFSYPGCSHAFARHGGLHYDADAAALANRRSWSFLRKTLA